MTEEELGSGRIRFRDLTSEEFERGMDWLSHEPVSYLVASTPEDGQDWITLVDPTREQRSLFREEILTDE